MEMIPVVSSNVKAIGWAGNQLIMDSGIVRDILRVEYLHGAIYDYLNVSKEVYDRLFASESKGSFINREIKPRYQSLRIN